MGMQSSMTMNASKNTFSRQRKGYHDDPRCFVVHECETIAVRAERPHFHLDLYESFERRFIISSAACEFSDLVDT